jgi:CMP-N-acetylneuraminic acid synthetase
MNLNVAAVVMPFAEAAVDVDTVSDWRLVEKILDDQHP